MKKNVFLTVVLLLTSLGWNLHDSINAQAPFAGEGPEWGASSKPGATMRPDTLPEVFASEGEIPRGYEFDRATLKSEVPASGDLPGRWDDSAASNPIGLIYTNPAMHSNSAPVLSTNFEGIPFTGFFPSDTVVAAGPDHVIQAVNRSFRVSKRDGTDPFDIEFGVWWSPVFTGPSPFSPKVVFDQYSNRWILLTVAWDDTNKKSWYLISVSKTSDPKKEWCLWALESHIDGSTPTANRGQYAQLGVDDKAIYITSNQYTFSSPQTFQYSKIRILEKSQFLGPTCGTISWWDLWDLKNTDGSTAFAIQPVHTFGTPGREFLINANTGNGNFLTLWSITNPTATPPTLTLEATITVGSYSGPPDATQLGTSELIHTGDQRLLNAVYRDGKIYTAHNINFSGDARCGFYVIDVTVPTSPQVKLDVAFGSAGQHYYFPAVMPVPSGGFVTVFNRSSSNEFASCRYTLAKPDATTATGFAFEPSSELRNGVSSYVLKDAAGRNRWGDYNGIGLDPNNSTRVWISSGFASATPNRWGTWIGAVPTPGTNPRFDITMSKPTYVNGDTITASEFRPQNPNTSATAIQLRIWLKIPTFGEVDLVNVGADGTFSLPANLNVNAGPLALIPVSATFPPKGNWEFNARVSNPATGAMFSEDINPFVVQ